MAESILIAGGAGFIGSHTAKELRRQGSIPVVLDNFCTGNRSAVRFGPLYEGDIGDHALVEKAIREHGIQKAILFAGHAYVGESTAAPRKYFENNISRSLRFLDTLVDCGVPNLVFSSSCSIYGMQPKGTLSEDLPADPLSPYAESKLFLERALHWYGKAYGLRSVCLRYFNAAGADAEGEIGETHDPETHLIPLAILAALTGRPLQVFGGDYPTPDGTCIRDYVHVSDLGRAHIKALDYLGSGGPSLILNVGTGTGSSIRQVIQVVEEVSGKKVPYTMQAGRAGDAPALVANPAKARDVLDWTPQSSDLRTIVSTAWGWLSR